MDRAYPPEGTWGVVKMKLKAEDIKIIGRNKQVVDKIKAKFGSLESFAETIGMSPKSVKQYLKQSADFNEHFRGHLCIHIGDYYTLWKSEVQQLEEYVDILVRDSYYYSDEKDIEVLEKVLKLSREYDIIKCVAKSYRNIGRHYLSRRLYSVSLGYYKFAKDYAEEAKNIDLICMVTSEMITAYTYMIEYRKGDKLSREFELLYPVEKISPDIRFWYYYSVCILFIHDKSYPYAMNYLTKAEACAGTDYQKLKIYSLLGIYYKKNEDYKKALNFYIKALELCEMGRDKGICYNNLASLYHAMGNREMAEENINIAMKYANPRDAENSTVLYLTYIEIYNNQECINILLDMLDKSKTGMFMPYVLDALHIILDKVESVGRLKNTIFEMIKMNDDNRKFVHELYMLLGAMVYRSEVNN